MSPEMLDNQKFTIKSDVWGLGQILYSLLALKTPFESIAAICRHKSEPLSPLDPRYSDEIRNLAESCLAWE
jgi:serine/threonine protein kinase